MRVMLPLAGPAAAAALAMLAAAASAYAAAGMLLIAVAVDGDAGVIGHAAVHQLLHLAEPVFPGAAGCCATSAPAAAYAAAAARPLLVQPTEVAMQYPHLSCSSSLSSHCCPLHRRLCNTTHRYTALLPT